MKNLLKTKHASGFTIIEVMIVLAIAGLIMVIVFIAVPQLQRNQRDNTRQSIVNRVKAEIETYGGNNQGNYPFSTAGTCTATTTGCWNNFFSQYINGKVNTNDPSTGNPVITATLGAPAACTNATCSSVTPPANRGDIAVVYGAACNGENLRQSPAGVTPTLTSRTFALIIGLDRGGTRYCVDNG